MKEVDDEAKWLAEQFERRRGDLRGLAYRMLGSLSEADDAVQESWLRLQRTGASGIQNVGGWLTTVVARVCLDALRSRRSRREDLQGDREPTPIPARGAPLDPEHEALLASSVGLALLVVLETLAPAERLAFVLHDLFDLPFDEIAEITGRSPVAARQLASRARRRIRGAPTAPPADLARQREAVAAFLGAARRGDFDALVAVLDPDVVLRADAAAAARGAARELRGAERVARRTIAVGAGAADVALVDGALAVVVAPLGKLLFVIELAEVDGKFTEIRVIGDPERLGAATIALLDH